MALATTISEQEAFAAIETIVKGGGNPTHQLVRTALGNRGSNPVISRFIGAWFSRYGAQLHAGASLAKAKEPVTALSDQILSASRMAAEQISEEEKQRKEALDNREATLNGREQALREMERKHDERALAHAELIRTLQDQVAESNTLVAQSSERAGQAERSLAAAEQAMAAMKEAHQALTSAHLDRFDELVSASVAQKAELEASRARLTDMTAAYEASQARAQALQAINDGLQAQLRQVQADGREAAQATGAALSQLQESMATVNTLTERVDDHVQSFAQAAGIQMTDLADAVRSANELQSALDQAHSALADTRQALLSGNARNEANDAHIATLKDQLTAANQEIERLRNGGHKQ